FAVNPLNLALLKLMRLGAIHAFVNLTGEKTAEHMTQPVLASLRFLIKTGQSRALQVPKVAILAQDPGIAAVRWPGGSEVPTWSSAFRSVFSQARTTAL
ncbi:MAG: hypothetical protein MKZ67_11985, partial [Acidimicrobiales bacterium]|nr:hypothetical protein [Acidimicrobiales bacterium]